MSAARLEPHDVRGDARVTLDALKVQARELLDLLGQLHGPVARRHARPAHPGVDVDHDVELYSGSLRRVVEVDSVRDVIDYGGRVRGFLREPHEPFYARAPDHLACN